MRICEAPSCNTPVFGTDKITRKGYCRSHQSLRTDLDQRSSYEKAMQPKNKLRSRNVSRVAIMSGHTPLLTEVEAQVIGKNVAQNKWYAEIAKEIEKKPNCWNCNAYIPKEYYRAATAHIFPKSLFPSVATHPLNYLVLGGGCGCHSEFDRSVEKASKMGIWPTACARFMKFEDLITENHKYYDLFKQYLAFC